MSTRPPFGLWAGCRIAAGVPHSADIQHVGGHITCSLNSKSYRCCKVSPHMALGSHVVRPACPTTFPHTPMPTGFCSVSLDVILSDLTGCTVPGPASALPQFWWHGHTTAAAPRTCPALHLLLRTPSPLPHHTLPHRCLLHRTACTHHAWTLDGHCHSHSLPCDLPACYHTRLQRS